MSITVHPTHPPIRVESIVLPRNVGEALGLGTPDGFSLTKTTLPDPRSFEPDLTELAEQGGPTSAEQIKRVTEAQYHEALGTATDMEGRYMTYEGELVIRRGTTASVMFPAAQAMPTAGTITVTYSNRSKLWRVAGGVSATFE